MSNHIPQNHPVAQLLRGAAHSGQALTTGDLASLDTASEHVTGGGSFTSFKADIASASQRIAALKADGMNQAARELADETTSRLAGRMTDGQRAVTSSSIAAAQQNTEDLADIDAMVRRGLANN